MKLNKLVAALSAVTMLGSLAAAVPASAKDITIGTSLTRVDTKADAVGYFKSDLSKVTSDDHVKLNSAGHRYEVYSIATSGTQEEMNAKSVKGDTTAIATFEVASVVAGEKITFTANVEAPNRDLAIAGLYFVPTGTAVNSYSDVLKATQVARAGYLMAQPSVSAKYPTGIFGDRYVAGFDSITNTENNKYDLKKEYTAAKAGKIYFIAAAYDAVTTDKNRKILVFNLKVDSDYTTLEAAVNGSAEDDFINVPSDQSVPGGRITVGKNLTIKSDTNDLREVTVKETEAAGGLLLNQSKTLTLENINVYPYSGTLNDGKYTLGVEFGTLNMTNGTVTGDATISKTGTLSLSNVTVTGKVYIDNKTNKSTLKADSNTTIGEIELAGAPTDGEIVVVKTGDTNLDPLQVTTFDYDGFELYTDASGNLAVRAEAVEPEPTKEYYTFDGKTGETYNTIVINATKGNETKEGEASITTITGGSLFVEITNIPAGVTINSVTLK